MSQGSTRRTFLNTLAAGALASCDSRPPRSKTQLGISGTRFTVNGKPVFLLGCSYYAALGAPAEVWNADLDDLQRLGFNWIRVWATWASFGNDISAVHPKTGREREPYLGKLKALLEDCDRRGMIVDVSLSRGNSVTGPAKLQKPEAHLRAVEVLVETLKPWSNWYLDLSNERNLTDKRHTGFEDLTRLRAAAKAGDASRLVTASHAGEFSPADLHAYAKTVPVDFLSPHRPRGAESPAQTKSRTMEWLTALRALGAEMPVHYQEPFRRGYGYSPALEDYLTNLRGAVEGGAAGWCFHQGDARKAEDGRPRRSFDLRDGRLFDQLDEVEKEAASALGKVAGTLPL